MPYKHPMSYFLPMPFGLPPGLGVVQPTEKAQTHTPLKTSCDAGFISGLLDCAPFSHMVFCVSIKLWDRRTVSAWPGHLVHRGWGSGPATHLPP